MRRSFITYVYWAVIGGGSSTQRARAEGLTERPGRVSGVRAYLLYMFKPWRLGAWMGFPIDVNPSFLLLLAFVFLAFGGLVGVMIVGLTFASVLLHELGHALVARRFGVRVSGIELGFFGGMAKMEQMPRDPMQELQIAAAGPAVSLMLAGAGLGLAGVTHLPLLALIGWINVVIAGFNLIPALPMDGGRILRALLASRLGFRRATDAAVIVARVATIGFALLGLAGAYQLLFLAPFLWMMTTREQHLAHMAPPNSGSGGGRGRYVVRQRDGRYVIVDSL